MSAFFLIWCSFVKTSDPFSNLPCFSRADLCFRVLNRTIMAGLSLLPLLGRGWYASTVSQSSFINQRPSVPPWSQSRHAMAHQPDRALPLRRGKNGARLANRWWLHLQNSDPFILFLVKKPQSLHFFYQVQMDFCWSRIAEVSPERKSNDFLISSKSSKVGFFFGPILATGTCWA